jgi:thiol-disulfide isomerase/thioredoxin
MKKFLTLGLFSLLTSFAMAQLPAGSTAPNFTATDINGNSWTLYDILGQGKTVIMDVSATWCGPCWAYHNSGALENLYESYGPNGTDEVMVLYIEGDGSTTLADLNGTGGNTQGNWVAGTPYPIIDNAGIASSYEITYFPTIYKICPDRKVTEVGQLSTAQLYSEVGLCPVAEGNNNGYISSYLGTSGSFCFDINPSIEIMNLGTSR